MDELPTVWEAEPHTVAKHGILKTYLQAWSAILSRSLPQPDELLFVDGFAGPGEYTNGVSGSPVVAVETIAEHQGDLSTPVRFLFIESRQDRWDHLRRLLAVRVQQLDKSKVRVDEPLFGDCDEVLTNLIRQRDRSRTPLGPALFFLDQFGYSQVPMALVEAIMAHARCEVFSYLNFTRMNHFLADETKWPGITAAYGDDSWKAALSLTGDEREKALLNAYTEALRRRARVDYVWPFAMFDAKGRLIHWLIFSTNSLKGLFEMKRAMWRMDQTGGFRFSDRDDPRQPSFLSDLDDHWLADELGRRLMGRRLTRPQVEAFVLTETPFYAYKGALKLLETGGRLTPAGMLQGRRRGAFPDNVTWSVQFAE